MLLTPLQEILKIGVLLKFLELAVLIQFRLAGVAGCGREQFGVGVVFWRGEVGWDFESGSAGSISSVELQPCRPSSALNTSSDETCRGKRILRIDGVFC